MSKKNAALSILCAFCLWHCSDADTLADEPPGEIVIEGVASWENGIGDLLKLKCGYCHASPIPPIAPDNIVTDLDLNFYETRVENGQVIRGADAIGRWIFERILDGPVEIFADTAFPRQMPLDYGTRVTEREKAILEKWSDEGLPRDSSRPPPPGDPNRGGPLYFGGGCASCHDLGGGVRISDGLYLGPAFRRAAVTPAKIKSMWLQKTSPEPISDQQALDIQGYIFQLLDEE